MGAWLTQLQQAKEAAQKDVPPHPVQSLTTSPASTPQNNSCLQAGWRVAYRDDEDHLKDGIIEIVKLSPQGRQSVVLKNGVSLSTGRLISVARVNDEGKVVAAWLVSSHGVTGDK